ncbi:glycosyltransferase [Streptomyces tricolor]|nr:glycosyltransferase [Streptomyces tricolor]
MDLFVHTGPFETFCQTVQEAMASGVPVVAPAVGGPLDLVDHGRTGLLVPPFDAAAVQEAVRALAADPARRAVYGAAARATVEGRTWAAVGDQLLTHYDDVLAARKTAVAA